MNDVTIGIGILGLGFMGRTHLGAYRSAMDARSTEPEIPECRVLALCDNRRAAEEDEGTPIHDDFAAILDDDAIHAVSICTPTDTHVELAIAALEAGKHVLVEKPIALASRDVETLRDAAAKSDRVCMPAMCMRFWPGWDWLLEQVAERTFGSVSRATFERLTGIPTWSPGFYDDFARSGGALVDLHIHDADFALACFGEPTEVRTKGTLSHPITTYSFEGQGAPTRVTAEAGWVEDPAFEFRMRFEIVFENAVATYDSSLAAPLRLATCAPGADAIDPSILDAADFEDVAIGSGDGYDGEVRHFLRCIAGTESPCVTLDDALRTARCLERERASLDADSEPVRA